MVRRFKPRWVNVAIEMNLFMSYARPFPKGELKKVNGARIVA